MVHQAVVRSTSCQRIVQISPRRCAVEEHHDQRVLQRLRRVLRLGCAIRVLGLGGLECRSELPQFVACKHAVAAAFLAGFLDAKGGIGGDPIALERKAEKPRDVRQKAIGHRGGPPPPGLDQRADLLARDVLHAHGPPDRQHLFFEDPPLPGNQLRFFSVAFLYRWYSAPTVSP